MTFPTLVPNGFTATAVDFNKAKIDRSGALRLYQGSIAVPVATAAGSIIGLIPLRKGARVLVHGAAVWLEKLDTTATLTASIGVIYNDTVNNTSVPGQYVASSTAPQNGGNVLLNAVEGGNTYVATGDGWLAVTMAGAATNVSANISWSVGIAYDQ